MGKQSKGRVPVAKNKLKNQQAWLILIPVVAFFIKVIVMINTTNGGWLGADGENYLSAVDGLRTDGFYSDVRNLHYWPAGYSVFIWPLTLISINGFLYFISIIQGLLFAYSTFLFTSQLLRTRVAFLAIATSFMISINPTLSLSSNVIGYETPVAGLLLLSIGLLLKDRIENPDNFSVKLVVFSGLAMGISCFFQPRILLFAVGTTLVYTLSISGKKTRLKFAALSLIVLMISPAVLVARNFKAIGSATLSTNLGTTVFIGIGDGATGGYNNKYNGVPCPAAEKGTEAQVDSAKVMCAISWYVSNPTKTITLAAKKSIFFWSPWFGPAANGTMARNPWLIINPIKNGIKTQETYNTVYGPVGKFVSWSWIFGQIILLFYGLIWLWRLGGTEKLLAKLTFVPIFLGWLISAGTIGDHRFRIPQMGLSLFLQVVGFFAIKKKLSKAL
jgi:hypothetical protein